MAHAALHATHAWHALIEPSSVSEVGDVQTLP